MEKTGKQKWPTYSSAVSLGLFWHILNLAFLGIEVIQLGSIKSLCLVREQYAIADAVHLQILFVLMGFEMKQLLTAHFKTETITLTGTKKKHLVVILYIYKSRNPGALKNATLPNKTDQFPAGTRMKGRRCKEKS